MKKFVFTTALSVLFVVVTSAQEAGLNERGMEYSKRIENNYHGGAYKRTPNGGLVPANNNLDSKGEVEKLLLDKINAQTEFYYEPSFEGASGFRVVRDSLDKSYVLEVKYISNYEEVTKALSEKYPTIGLPMSIAFSMPRDVDSLILVHNNAMTKKHYEEQPNLFNVQTLSLPLSDKFADQIYYKMVLLIDNFKGKGVPPMSFDGYVVTFRTVVEDEVWSLNIHMPQGNALLLSDLCRQIISDAQAGKFNEAAYLDKLK